MAISQLSRDGKEIAAAIRSGTTVLAKENEKTRRVLESIAQELKAINRSLIIISDVDAKRWNHDQGANTDSI